MISEIESFSWHANQLKKYFVLTLSPAYYEHKNSELLDLSITTS